VGFTALSEVDLRAAPTVHPEAAAIGAWPDWETYIGLPSKTLNTNIQATMNRKARFTPHIEYTQRGFSFIVLAGIVMPSRNAMNEMGETMNITISATIPEAGGCPDLI
jgi:hypothetical protein